jgi:cyclase
MFAKSLCAIALFMTGAAVAGSVQDTLTAQLVKTGLYMIAGGGCNSLLRLSANGLILVDGKLPGNYEAILAKTKKLSFSEQPIVVLITTDQEEAHTGNNAKFLAAGTQIIAQENVKQNPTATITYSRDYMLRLGGVEAQLMHFGNAHSNGDTVVYFPNLKVVAVGDLFAANPDPDFSAGGSLVGWGAVLGQILKLDFDVAVPSNGPMISRAELAAFKGKMDTLVSRASELVARGVPKGQLMGELKTDDLGWRFNFTGRDLDSFYAELSRTK